MVSDDRPAYLDVPVLTGLAEATARTWIRYAAEVARKASCLRSRCGSVIVAADGAVLATGVNQLPCAGQPSFCRKDQLPEDFRSDRTCCMHAEQNALLEAMASHPTKVPGASLYFVRLDADGLMAPAAAPYCTICSKMALTCGISRFVLLHADGIRSYDTFIYNELSFGAPAA